MSTSSNLRFMWKIISRDETLRETEVDGAAHE